RFTNLEPNEKSKAPHPAIDVISSNHGFARPVVRGKFLYCNDQKLWVRGVTYGTFRPDQRGSEFHNRDRVQTDFLLMADAGINAVRTYTVPPLWFLNLAYRQGLYVMVGLPWEQHIAFLDDRQQSVAIRKRVRDGVRLCSKQPAAGAGRDRIGQSSERPREPIAFSGSAGPNSICRRLRRGIRV